MKWVFEQWVGVKQSVSSRFRSRGSGFSLGSWGLMVGMSVVVWDSFSWGVVMSLGSFSLVFLLCLFRLCVVWVILKWVWGQLVGFKQWVSKGSADRLGWHFLGS